MARKYSLLWVLIAALPGMNSAVDAQVQMSPDAVAGLDHIPFAVADLDATTTIWRALGFTIKPGREHANGIRNSHIKFEDGSGIELLTAPAAVDAMTTTYRALIDQGGGPAYLGLHARDMDRLKTTLAAKKYPLVDNEGLLLIDNRYLDYLFFLEDNRAADDKYYIQHPNAAYAMVRVWVATNRSRELADLLVLLGGEQTSRAVYVPERVGGSKVVTLTNGEVVILPVQQQLTKGVSIVGATFRVPDVAALERRLTISQIPFTMAGSGNQSVVIAPEVTGGMWLEFQE